MSLSSSGESLLPTAPVGTKLTFVAGGDTTDGDSRVLSDDQLQAAAEQGKQKQGG